MGRAGGVLGAVDYLRRCAPTVDTAHCARSLRACLTVRGANNTTPKEVFALALVLRYRCASLA